MASTLDEEGQDLEAEPESDADEPFVGADYGSPDPEECASCHRAEPNGVGLFGGNYCLHCAGALAVGILQAPELHSTTVYAQAVIIVRAILADAEKAPIAEMAGIKQTAAIIAAMSEMLRSCERWFAKHNPTAPTILGRDAEHPMLTGIRAALKRAA